MRSIDSIILHCTDSNLMVHDQHALKYLYDWHVRENHWSDIAYHFVISKSKGIEIARPINIKGAHCHGYNEYSIGIALTGQNNFSQYQFDLLNKLILNLVYIFNLTATQIYGHNQFCSKTCPNFDIIPIRRWIDDRIKS